MKRPASDRLTSQQRAETGGLAPAGADIDALDVNERPEGSGALFRPVKLQITLRLDADVVDWFRRHPERGEGYQTRINRALREYVRRRGHDFV